MDDYVWKLSSIFGSGTYFKNEDTSFGHDALHALTIIFFVPLQNASIECSVIVDEWDAMVDYAKRYLDLVREDYKAICMVEPSSSADANIGTFLNM